MESNPDQDRRQAHALLDALPPEKLNAVRSLLEVMVEPLARSLALAQIEEETLTRPTLQPRWTMLVLRSLAERASRTMR
jgi:hypothetical protein